MWRKHDIIIRCAQFGNQALYPRMAGFPVAPIPLLLTPRRNALTLPTTSKCGRKRVAFFFQITMTKPFVTPIAVMLLEISLFIERLAAMWKSMKIHNFDSIKCLQNALRARRHYASLSQAVEMCENKEKKKWFACEYVTLRFHLARIHTLIHLRLMLSLLLCHRHAYP